MSAYLRFQTWYGVVDGSEPVPLPYNATTTTAEELKEIRRYADKRNQALGAIMLCVEENQKVHIRGMDSPKAVWDKLRSVHLQQHPGRRFLTYSSLFHLKKSEDESLSYLMSRADQLLSDMKALRPTSFTIDDLDSELVCMSLLNAPPSTGSPSLTTQLGSGVWPFCERRVKH